MSQLMSMPPMTRRTMTILIWSLVTSVLFVLLAVFLGFLSVFTQMGAQCWSLGTCIESVRPLADVGIHAGPVIILVAVWVLIGLCIRRRSGRGIWLVWSLGFVALYGNFYVWTVVNGYAMTIPSWMVFGGAPM